MTRCSWAPRTSASTTRVGPRHRDKKHGVNFFYDLNMWSSNVCLEKVRNYMQRVADWHDVGLVKGKPNSEAVEHYNAQYPSSPFAPRSLDIITTFQPDDIEIQRVGPGEPVSAGADPVREAPHPDHQSVLLPAEEARQGAAGGRRARREGRADNCAQPRHSELPKLREREPDEPLGAQRGPRAAGQRQVPAHERHPLRRPGPHLR